MSIVITTGEIAAAAGDAYGASQGDGGLNSSANQASFGAAVAAGAAALASAISSPGTNGSPAKLPFLNGLATGVAPAASVTQLAMNIANLQNPNATPAEALAASLGILGGAAGTLAGLIPPAAMLTPQGAAAKTALTGIAIAASAAQLGIQQNLSTVNELINDLVRNWNSLLNDLGDFFGDLFNRAKNWTWPRDPIILDLNGDGLETVGLAANIHFDHDGDGVLTKTGWAGKDDALLVWDRNANGRIDTGAELFGDFTVLPNGTLAPNGFAALAALDANGDGILDASDPAFAELKLWRDTSQDGVSQGGEFITLAEAGIVSLNLANTLKNQGLANGNTLSREGSFTRANGTTSAMGEFRLAADTFSTKFAEQIEVPEALKTLPTLQGSGNVRELQQAAAQSDGVAGVLAQFQSATTRAEQKSLLDSLITAWADTSGMTKSLEERAAGKYRIQYEAFGVDRRSASLRPADGGGTVGGSEGLLSDLSHPLLTERYRTLMADWSRKLHVLEAFNGQYFFNLPGQKSQTQDANWGLSVQAGSGGAAEAGMPLLRVNFSQPQLNLLQQAYDSLKESVYASLVMQTRLKPYLDQIELFIGDTGLRMDATSLNQMIDKVPAKNRHWRCVECANDNAWGVAA